MLIFKITFNFLQTYKNQLQKIQEGFVCRVCMDKEISTTLCPCGHMVCCSECADRLDECPVCRTAINKIQPVFLPTPVMAANGQRSSHDHGKCLTVIAFCVWGGRDIAGSMQQIFFCDFYSESVDFIGMCAYRTCSSSSHFMLLKIIFVNIVFINLIHHFVTHMSPKGAYHALGAFCSCKDL